MCKALSEMHMATNKLQGMERSMSTSSIVSWACHTAGGSQEYELDWVLDWGLCLGVDSHSWETSIQTVNKNLQYKSQLYCREQEEVWIWNQMKLA